MNNFLKIFLLFGFSLLTITTTARQIKLNYIPKGVIVAFYFDSLKIYTDTTSLLKLIDNSDTGYYAKRSRQFILKAVQRAHNDTISFNDGFIPFNDDIDNKSWNAEYIIKQLTINNRAMVFDRLDRPVKKIVTKRIKTVSPNRKKIRRAYINKDTKEELFSDLLYLKTSCW